MAVGNEIIDPGIDPAAPKSDEKKRAIRLQDAPNYAAQKQHIARYLEWRAAHGFTCERVLVEVCEGNRNCLALLEQILYWTIAADGSTRLRYKYPRRSSNLLLIKTGSEWDLEIGLKRRALENARQFLAKRGIISSERHRSRIHRGGVAIHYEVRFKELNRQIAAVLMRFGPPDESEHSTVIDHLDRFAHALLTLQPVKRGYIAKSNGEYEQLQPVIEARLDRLRVAIREAVETTADTSKVDQLRLVKERIGKLYEHLYGPVPEPLPSVEALLENVKEWKTVAFAWSGVGGDGAASNDAGGLEIRRLQLVILQSYLTRYKDVFLQVDDHDDERLHRDKRSRQKKTLQDAWYNASGGVRVKSREFDAILAPLEDELGTAAPAVILAAAAAACGCVVGKDSVLKVLQALPGMSQSELQTVVASCDLPDRVALPPPTPEALERALRSWLDASFGARSAAKCVADIWGENGRQAYADMPKVISDSSGREGLWSGRNEFIVQLTDAVRRGITYPAFKHRVDNGRLLRTSSSG